MTPKEKAEELVNKYIELVPEFFGGMDRDLAKQCAFIAVDEIISTHPLKMVDWGKLISDIPYWQEIKQEIEKL